MAVVELDSVFVRAIKYLHSSAVDSEYCLGILLDEAIKSTYGTNNELTNILNNPPMEYSAVSSSMYDSVSELDLLKEDLTCVVCKEMNVTAKNQLLECSDCHSLYHQECHMPPIYQDEIEAHNVWFCGNCKR